MTDFSRLARSYDLRGVYGVDISDDFYTALWYAFARHTGARTIALGYDARLSAIALRNAFARGVISAGSRLIDLGLCSSDMLSFSTCHFGDIEAGVMITASHNPADQNGAKLFRRCADPIDLRVEWASMIEIMDSLDLDSLQTDSTLIESRDILEDWITHVLSFSRGVDLSRLRIVCDAGNGAAGSYLPRLAERAGFTIIPLFLEPDGRFPHHHPNPMLAENREQARQSLIEQGADLALLFDGDADRVVILDDRGEMVVSGVICAVIAEKLLHSAPAQTIAGNAVISHTLRDRVEELGGRYIRTRVDSVAIKKLMAEDQSIIFAGEHSTHYFTRENWNIDSGIVASMIFLSVFARQSRPMSEWLASVARYVTLEETNYRVRDRQEVVEALRQLAESEEGASLDSLDGLTVSYPDMSWWNIRASNNEPLIRLNMEAKTEERFEELREKLEKRIQEYCLS